MPSAVVQNMSRKRWDRGKDLKKSKGVCLRAGDGRRGTGRVLGGDGRRWKGKRRKRFGRTSNLLKSELLVLVNCNGEEFVTMMKWLFLFNFIR